MEFINLLWKSKGRKSKCSSCKMNNVCRAIPWCWQNKRCVCDILTCVQQRKLCYIYHVHNTRNLPIFSFMCSKNRCQSSTLPVFLYWLVFRILQHMTVSRVGVCAGFLIVIQSTQLITHKISYCAKALKIRKKSLTENWPRGLSLIKTWTLSCLSCCILNCKKTL